MTGANSACSNYKPKKKGANMPKKVRVTHLNTRTEGFVTIIHKPFIKRLFCDHINIIVGFECSAQGVQRTNGNDIYTMCRDCGEIINEQHSLFELYEDKDA